MKRSDGLSRNEQLRRKMALARSTKRLKRTRLRPVSSKARTHEARMDRLRPLVFARDAWRCQAGAHGCLGVAHHAHHLLPRGRGGPDTLENLTSVCFPCHLFIHGNPVWAGERGLLARGYGKGDAA